ncbi:FG-GAP repeat domain-containing protein [Nannocystis bainbridge]|uniref:VCBS repeat-containing protein n=1 Tax=Nannocystis bainbridge TaxID=2995303 RepID=A0ABT5E453_9BACT|nr:VCBS repeat-containing protein [Nannocystis bainbridge]MDC0720185.1 VCBS repeat-containing protein [Nannocystis bainbridge]
MPRALAVVLVALAACPAPSGTVTGTTGPTTTGSTSEVTGSTSEVTSSTIAAPTSTTSTTTSTSASSSTTAPEPADLPWYEDFTATLPGPSTTGQTMEARAADLDGDGDLDLVLAKEWQPNALLLNDGTGHSFKDASDRIPQAVHDHEDIAIADLDGDGDLDIVVASEDDAAKELYLNDGQALFVDASDRLPQLGKSNAVAAADIDGDGDLDLVFGCDGAERIFVNDGAAVFSDESAVRIAATTDVTQDVALGDLDGDGDLDLVLGNEDGNRLLFNDGAGHFSDVTEGRLPPPAAPEETRNADLGDLDGDGDLDLYFSNVRFRPDRDPQDRLLINDGAGAFADETATRLGVEQWWTMDTDFVDVDADGDLDLVQAIIPAGKRYRLRLNDGAGLFTDVTDTHLPATAIGAGVEVEAGDYDGDGRLDLYLTGFDSPDRLLVRK